MDFSYTAEEEELRAKVREFIAENLTAEIDAELDAGRSRRSSPLVKALYDEIVQRGWMAISWPKEYGGQSGSRIQQYIIEDEFARAGLAVGGAGSGAPTILAAGTEEQREFFVKGLINGRTWGYRSIQALLALAVVALAGYLIAYGEAWEALLASLVWAANLFVNAFLAVSFVVALPLRYRGCELGALPALLGGLRGEPDRGTSPCLVGLHRIDEWEDRRRVPDSGLTI